MYLILHNRDFFNETIQEQSETSYMISGKCVPCRIGLGQLNHLITDVLDGKATMETLEVMEETAVSIMETADCAIYSF